MELVYLWVEKYKNIEKQGFNFSGQYRCDYDPEKNEITIHENKEYVHIFPKNINVTAIVGKNGSGKSSVLTGLTNHKIIIRKDGELYSNDFTSEEINIKKPLLRDKDYEIIYIDFDLIKIHSVRDYWDHFALNIFDKNLYNQLENGLSSNNVFDIEKFRKNFFNIVLRHIEFFYSRLFFFNPSYINLSIYFSQLDKKNETYKRLNEIIVLVNALEFNDYKKHLLIFLLKKSILESEDPVYTSLKLLKAEDIYTLEDEIISSTGINNKDELYSFLDALRKFDLKQIDIEEFRSLYSFHKTAFHTLLEIGYLQYDFTDSIGRKYFDLSQGERKLFTELLMLHDKIFKTKKQDIFVVLDEPDLTLHPEWQRKYLDEAIRLLSIHDKNFHIIITSHSPFILSDIPKQNVIFLEDGKQVYPDIDTFGANIHALLSHGFFMDEGLMGEFAKNKINEVVHLLKSKKKLSQKDFKHCEYIISIIGEPVLQKTLQTMLNEKKSSRLTKLEKLKIQQKEIEDQIKALEENQ